MMAVAWTTGINLPMWTGLDTHLCDHHKLGLMLKILAL